LNDSELDEVERWLDIPDQQIFAWVNGMEPVPSNYDTGLFHQLRSFHSKAAV
jgi:antitoxin CptB